MAAATTAASNGPGNRSVRRENDDLLIYTISAIDSTDTVTPFPTTGVQRSIIDWAIKPVSAVDVVPSAGAQGTAVNVGNGAEMKVVYTPATSSAAAYFTFTCTAGTGLAYLYVWAK